MNRPTRSTSVLAAILSIPAAITACNVSVPVNTGGTPTGPQCMDAMSATASKKGTTQGPVEVQARLDWRNKVQSAHGAGYSQWSKAQQRDMTCSHDGKLIKTWTCTATARPCKS